jgi:glycosyltransferase involved in cell wall biosynthesis
MFGAHPPAMRRFAKTSRCFWDARSLIRVLSLCMIVRDEEAVLSRCLDSVADVVDEIVIVDTGSTDATVAIAREHKATVLHHDFSPVDFAAARNAGLARARGDNVLVLDADESLDPDCKALVRALSAANRNIGYVVTRRNIPAEPATTPWLDHAVRLFPQNPDFRYAGIVHETIDASILDAGAGLRRCDIVLNHHLPPAELARQKGLRYLELLRSECSDDPDRLVFLGAEYHKLQMYAEATAVAERVAELAPDDFTAQFNAALCHHFFTADADRAQSDLAAALRIRPDDPAARNLLIAIRAGTG